MGPRAAGEADETRDAPDAPPPARAASAPAESGSEDPFASLQRDLSHASSTHTGDPGEARAPIAPAKPGASLQPRESLAPGASLGHYEIIRLLGKGGMGEVYLARDTRLGRKVALKRLLGISAHTSARFLREARATAQLAHENIVALHELADHQGSPLLVLEFVPGKTLADWLKARAEADPLGQRPRLPEARAAELMLPVARALGCAHEAGIVHRDLKPANIMLADSGAIKVLDFGVAKLLGQEDDDEPSPLALASSAPPSAEDVTEIEAPELAARHAALHALTRPGTIIGTRAYMAPEQWRDEPVDGRTDLWALGVILFQLVTGEHPLEPLVPDALLTVGVLELPMPSVRERAPQLGKLAAVIDRCLLKHKDDRLGSARELCEALEAIARPHAQRPGGEDDDEQNPYAGLAAFQEQDEGRFFGREALVAQLALRCAELPLLALVGASGAGKSSLVRAGLIPALKRGGEAWEAFVTRPGPHPLAALTDLLLQHAFQRSSQSADAAASSSEDSLLLTNDRAVLLERLRREPGLLGVALRARAKRRLERILLFVDQFEEVFTLAPKDERTACLACLAGAADDPSSPLRIVISVRHDFLDRLAANDSALAELTIRGTVLVGPLDHRGLERALVAPAEARSYRFESPALVAEMIASLDGAAAALPLLQFTGQRLWEGRDRTQHLLTEACYRSFGGVGGALASHADSVLASLGLDDRLKARSLLLRLVTPERTRAIVPRRELDELIGAHGAALERVLDHLIDARLLTVEGSGNVESTIELVHESLIASWPLLSRWLDDAQDDAQLRARLRAVALEWDSRGRPEGLLWRGEAAEEARRFHVRLAQQDGPRGAPTAFASSPRPMTTRRGCGTPTAQVSPSSCASGPKAAA